MKKTAVYVTLLVVVSLGAGVVLGMGIAKKAGYARHLAFKEKIAREIGEGPVREHAKQDMLERLSRKLNLSPEQTAQVKEILEASKTGVKILRDQTLQGFKAIKEDTNVKIKAILTPEQQVEFERLNMERKEHEFMKKGVRRPSHPEGRGPGPDREEGPY